MLVIFIFVEWYNNSRWIKDIDPYKDTDIVYSVIIRKMYMANDAFFKCKCTIDAEISP